MERDVHIDFMMNTPLKEKTKPMLDKVTEYTEEAKTKSSEFIDEKTSILGEHLETANEKAARLKERAEQGYERKVSPAIDTAQVNLAGASRYLQESSVDDYIRDAEDFARRHPRITVGITMLIGWKLGRLLKFGK
ncbi:MAG: hypothetical protein ACSHYF_09320 [Verrucomicrobiaceae bacterium]